MNPDTAVDQLEKMGSNTIHHSMWRQRLLGAKTTLLTSLKYRLIIDHMSIS